MNWVIGDVHGMYLPLRRLLDLIDAEDPGAQLTFAGDFVNRGPDSKGVIDLLLTLGFARFCRGNHDDIFDLVLNGRCFSPKAAGGTPGAAFQWFMDFGLDRTLVSYGLDWAWLRATAAKPSGERLQQVSEAVPDTHREFIRSLPGVVDDETFYVVHGHWPATAPCGPADLAAARSPNARQAMLWKRYDPAEIAADKPAWGRRAFVGHTPVHTYFPDPAKAPLVPITGPKLTLLDTSCALLPWGRLTGYCVEEDRIIQVSHDAETVEQCWRPVARAGA